MVTLLLSVCLLSEQLGLSPAGSLGRVHKVTRFNGHWPRGQEALVKKKLVLRVDPREARRQ